MPEEILWFKDCSYKNKNLVGGKCCSLGELYHLSKKLGFEIADGFAITTFLYDKFIEYNNLNDIICNKINNIDVNNIKTLEFESKELRDIIINANFKDEDKELIIKSYNELCNFYKNDLLEVAIRSSAIAEDLENASFAGQQDTYLNVRGYEELLLSIKKCFASLFNGRAISYRNTHNIQLCDVKISVAVQKMVRSDIGCAGVAFSIDPESGYDKAIIINSSFGLGELVVSGGVKPDEFILDKRVLNLLNEKSCVDPIIMKKNGDKNSKIIYNEKGGVEEVETSLFEKKEFSLDNNNIIKLGKIVLDLENKYSNLFNKKIGIDVEWALDGIDKNIYIIQTRPETIHSISDNLEISKYIFNEKSKILV